jgi:hypothetical protein
LVALTACGDATLAQLDDRAMTGDSDIVNGKNFSGLPAVGLVSLPGALCTGALIAPHVVLTAAHCVGQHATEWDASDNAFEVTDGTKKYRVASKHVSTMAPWVNSGDGDYDQAIITLAQDIPVATLPLMDSVSLSSVGRTVFLVGYGITGEGRSDAGVKRAVTGTVDGIDSFHLKYGSASGTVCSGDSGGPVLHQRADGGYEIAATNRVVYAPYCQSVADGTRVDAHRTWINGVLAQAGTGTYGGGGGSGGGASKAITVAAKPSLCMDVYYGGTKNGTPVQLYACNGGTGQQWTATGGTIRALGKCLTAMSGQTGAAIKLWDCTYPGNQTWVVDNGRLRLGTTSMCVDIPSANLSAWQQLQLYPCNSTSAQQWNVPF